MFNIETKVKITNLEAIKTITASFASFVGVIFQEDTYFLLGNKRLKTREGSNRYELIYYKREDKLESKNSQYFDYHFNKIFFLIVKVVLRFFLGTKKIIEKNRYLYIYKNTRIHLDVVKNLGTFLELETIVKNTRDYGELIKEHEEIFIRLHLETTEKISGSYSDL